VLSESVRPNGLRLRKVSVPIGVVAIVYEARPSVTADAAGLCFKSGNAAVLRGGSEAIRSNRAIAGALGEALPAGALELVASTDRAAVKTIARAEGLVDLLIPRGGEGLVRAVAAVARVPVIKHYKGVCHVFIDEKADPGMAIRIAVNAKCQRPGTCNAMET